MMLYDEMTPDLSQCKRIRELSKKKKLDGYALEEIFHELKGCQQNRIYFNKSKIISQLPVELAKRDKRYIEKYIIEAIRFYKANKND